jgi:hypothetical protein
MNFQFRHGIPNMRQRGPPRQVKRFCKDCDAIVTTPTERCGRCNKIQEGITKWKREMWLLYGDGWEKYEYLEQSQELKKEFIKN